MMDETKIAFSSIFKYRKFLIFAALVLQLHMTPHLPSLKLQIKRLTIFFNFAVRRAVWLMLNTSGDKLQKSLVAHLTDIPTGAVFV